MEREEAEAIYDAGREAVVEALVGFSAVVEQVAALEAEVEELKRQVGRDSRNSSMPPSSDPPKSRAERRRAAREAYKRSLRSSGGQPGHEGRSREMAAPEQVDRRFDHIPPDRSVRSRHRRPRPTAQRQCTPRRDDGEVKGRSQTETKRHRGHHQ